MSYTEIGRKHHVDPRTAKKYAESSTRPEYVLSEPKPSKLDPYKEMITVWLNKPLWANEVQLVNEWQIGIHLVICLEIAATNFYLIPCKAFIYP